MNKLKELLFAEQCRLEKIITVIKERLKNAPEGTLRLSKSHNKQQYYSCTSERKAGIYINKDNIELARQLAQKTYDEKVLKLAEKRLLQIKKITKNYKENEIEEIYLKERIERQELIKPIEPTWQQKLNEWKSKEYKGKSFREETPTILSEKGERVRSKSEKIMADYFYRNGIEYKYECPLYLKGVESSCLTTSLARKEFGKELFVLYLIG